MLVALSTGHSKQDSGAVSPIDGTKEYDVNCGIVDLMEMTGLRRGEFEIVDVPYEDMPYPNHLICTVKAINHRKHEYACCVEIHHNASVNEKVHGAQAIYWDTSVVGKGLATLIANNLAQMRQVSPQPLKKFWKDTQKEYYQPGALSTIRHIKRRLYYLNKTLIPAVIVEVGYLTNPSDLRYSQHYQVESAIAVCNGIDEFLGVL